MDSKICTRCKNAKSLDLFPKDKRNRDGRASRCNACMSEVLRAYKETAEGRKARLDAQARYSGSEKGKAKRKEYAKSPKAKAQRRDYAQTERGKQVLRISREKYRRADKMTVEGRIKCKARKAIFDEISRGQLLPPGRLRCYYCGAQAEQYHHYAGYEKEQWFDVLPVCRKCHHSITHPPVKSVAES